MSTPTLGGLVQLYTAEQCRVILDAMTVLRAHDEEAVHPARVAVRRLRATLRTFARVYRRSHTEPLADELRWWGEVLGRLRDLRIVEQRVLDALCDAPAAQLVVARVAAEREIAWRRFDESAGGTRFAALAEELERRVTDPPFGQDARLPASAAIARVDHAAHRLSRRLRRAAKALKQGTRDADIRIHTARKAAKRHRYAVELARPVLGPRADAELDRLKHLQDALGERQDAVVTLAWLDGFDASAAARLEGAAAAQRQVIAAAATTVAGEAAAR